MTDADVGAGGRYTVHKQHQLRLRAPKTVAVGDDIKDEYAGITFARALHAADAGEMLTVVLTPLFYEPDVADDEPLIVDNSDAS